MRAAPLSFLAAFLAAVPAAAQRVGVEGGDVVYHASEEAAPRRLTRSGLDSDPVLSPDGRTVAFIRLTPADSVETPLGPEEATGLWTVGVDGRGERLLLAGRGAEIPGDVLAALHAPRFAPDGARIYVLSAAWAESRAVHAVDPATGESRFVVAAQELEVVPRGDYGGFLVVRQQRRFLGGGTYSWLWLFSPEGTEVGPIGEDEDALAEFEWMYVEDDDG